MNGEKKWWWKGEECLSFQQETKRVFSLCVGIFKFSPPNSMIAPARSSPAPLSSPTVIVQTEACPDPLARPFGSTFPAQRCRPYPCKEGGRGGCEAGRKAFV